MVMMRRPIAITPPPPPPPPPVLKEPKGEHAGPGEIHTLPATLNPKEIAHKAEELGKHLKDAIGDLLEKKGTDIGKVTGKLNLPDAAKIGIGLAGGGVLGGLLGGALKGGDLGDKLAHAAGEALNPFEHAGNAIGDLFHGDIKGAAGEVKEGVEAVVDNVKHGAESVISALNPFD